MIIVSAFQSSKNVVMLHIKASMQAGPLKVAFS